MKQLSGIIYRVARKNQPSHSLCGPVKLVLFNFRKIQVDCMVIVSTILLVLNVTIPVWSYRTEFWVHLFPSLAYCPGGIIKQRRSSLSQGIGTSVGVGFVLFWFLAFVACCCSFLGWWWWWKEKQSTVSQSVWSCEEIDSYFQFHRDKDQQSWFKIIMSSNPCQTLYCQEQSRPEHNDVEEVGRML